MTEAMKALARAEVAVERLRDEFSSETYIDGEGALQTLEEVLPTLRAALTPPADDEIKAVRARHEAWEASTISVGSHAHTDRATLLRALDAERARRVEVEGALKLFMSAATPVSTDIDPRGYAWSLAYLDQARATLTKD